MGVDFKDLLAIENEQRVEPNYKRFSSDQIMRLQLDPIIFISSLSV